MEEIIMYPNAYDGIKKIYSGEILSLIAILVGGVSAIVTAITSGIIESGVEDVANSIAFLGGSAVLIIAGVITIISFFLNIIGISKASKDEPNFKKASTWLIISLLASAGTSFFKNNELLTTGIQTIYQIAEVLVTIYVLAGIIALAEKMGREDVKKKAVSSRTMILIIYVIVLVLTVFSGFANAGDTTTIITGVLGIAALIAMIAAYILYLKALSGAKKMLAK
jgi:hypothetical protein